MKSIISFFILSAITHLAQADSTYVRCYVSEYGLTQISVFDSPQNFGERVFQIHSLKQDQKPQLVLSGVAIDEKALAGGTRFFTQMPNQEGHFVDVHFEITQRRVKITEVGVRHSMVDSPVRSCVDGN